MCEGKGEGKERERKEWEGKEGSRRRRRGCVCEGVSGEGREGGTRKEFVWWCACYLASMIALPVMQALFSSSARPLLLRFIWLFALICFMSYGGVSLVGNVFRDGAGIGFGVGATAVSRLATAAVVILAIREVHILRVCVFCNIPKASILYLC